MRRLIVGCGYLGLRVAERWRLAGDEVWVLTRSDERAVDLEQRGLKPVVGDVTLPKTLSALPEVDTVLWAVGWDRSSGVSQREVYVGGLSNVLNRVAGRCSRLITISSTSVYGQSAGEWIDEFSACEPVQPNGQTCLDAEHLVRGWSPGSGGAVAATVLRLSGIYGPGRLLSRAAALRNAEPLAGNPDAWLNLIHVEDAAEVVVECANHVDLPPLLLISDNEPVLRRTYYSALAELVEAPPPHFAEDSAMNSAPATRTVGLNKRCRNEMARKTLHWEPRFPTYREGLLQAVGETAER